MYALPAPWQGSQTSRRNSTRSVVARRERPGRAVFDVRHRLAVPVDVRARARAILDDHERPVTDRHRFKRRKIIDGRLDLLDGREIAHDLLLQRRRDTRDLFDGDPGADRHDRDVRELHGRSLLRQARDRVDLPGGRRFHVARPHRAGRVIHIVEDGALDRDGDGRIVLPIRTGAGQVVVQDLSERIADRQQRLERRRLLPGALLRQAADFGVEVARVAAGGYLTATSSSSAGNGSLIRPLASIRAPIQRAPWTSGVSGAVFSFMRMLSMAAASGCVPVAMTAASATQPL